jgi:uncharacterized protein YcfJ
LPSRQQAKQLSQIALVLLPFVTTAQAEPPVPLCQQYADSYAHRQASGGVLKGGAVGAGVGAAIGSFFGGAGTGAAIGGGLGAIGGGARKSSEYKTAYVDGFTDCMAGRVKLPQ